MVIIAYIVAIGILATKECAENIIKPKQTLPG